MNITIIPKSKDREKFIELYPPKLSNEFLPEWYKNIELGSSKASWVRHHLGDEKADELDLGVGYTAKKCPAIQDVLTEGLIIPLWGKLYIGHEYDEENNPIQMYHAFTGDQFNNHQHVTTHEAYQIEGMDIGTRPDGRILKIELPYKILVPDGYSILYSDPFYHFRNDIRCLTGLVEADKWGYVTFPFSVLNPECVIEAGTPIIHAMIFKKNTKINLETRLGTEQEYKDIELEMTKFYIQEKDYRKQND